MNNSKGVSVYERAGRPVYYVSFIPSNGYDRVHRSTQFRIDDAAAKARAFEWAREQAKESRVYRAGDEELWHQWVPGFLDQRYRRSPLTLKRYRGS